MKNTPFSDIAEIDPDSLSLESGNTAEAPEQVLQAGAEPPEEALPSVRSLTRLHPFLL